MDNFNDALLELKQKRIIKYDSDVSKQLGVAKSAVSEYTKGFRVPSAAFIEKFNAYYGQYGVMLSDVRTKFIESKVVHESKGAPSKLILPKSDYGKNPVSTQKYNFKLAKIAKELNIKKPLSSHIARHTFATLFLTLGGSIEVLSKLLGHTKIGTTQIYGKIINTRIDDEVSRVFG